MELDNRTPYAARLFSGNIGEGLKGAWVVARATFRLASEALTPVAANESWPVFAKPVMTDVGVFPADEYPFRRGCELVITGTVRAPRPVSELTVRAQVGDFVDRMLVVGDRVWRRGAVGLEPSDAQPFTEMPMSWTRAFGGATSRNGLASHHPLNPTGRGYHASEDAAEGSALPNFEDPDARIARWSDHPLPVGWAPVENAPAWQLAEFSRARAERGDYGTPSLEEMADLGLALNPTACAPRYVMHGIAAGATANITGVEASPIRFVVPDLRLRVRALVGERATEKVLSYSGLWVLASHGLVVLTLRAAFSYAMRAEEARGATLEAVDLP